MQYENMRMPELKSPFQWGIKYCQWQHFTYSRISDFPGKLHKYYIRLKPYYSFNS